MPSAPSSSGRMGGSFSALRWSPRRRSRAPISGASPPGSEGAGSRMRLASFVWKNMVRNRRRTVLTVLSIGLSLFLLSTLMTVLTELGRESEGGDQHLRLVVRRASSLGDPLPEAYLEK